MFIPSVLRLAIIQLSQMHRVARKKLIKLFPILGGGLHPGSIPAFYREIHEKICSPSGNVEREVFKSLLVKSQLSSNILSQVGELFIFYQGIFHFLNQRDRNIIINKKLFFFCRVS